MISYKKKFSYFWLNFRNIISQICLLNLYKELLTISYYSYSIHLFKTFLKSYCLYLLYYFRLIFKRNISFLPLLFYICTYTFRSCTSFLNIHKEVHKDILREIKEKIVRNALLTMFWSAYILKIKDWM